MPRLALTLRCPTGSVSLPGAEGQQDTLQHPGHAEGIAQAAAAAVPVLSLHRDHHHRRAARPLNQQISALLPNGEDSENPS